MKLQILTQSGRPSDPVMAKEYEQKWHEAYDKSERKAKAVFNKQTGKLTQKPEMIILQRLLRFCEHSLNKKYIVVEQVELPKTSRQWNKLLEKYQFPVLVNKNPNGKMELVLMDQIQ